jgi:hypothetical protein
MSEQLKTKDHEQFKDTGLESEGSERRKQLQAERERSAAEKERSSAEKEDTARHEVERVVAEQEKKSHEKQVASPAERRRDAPLKNTKATRDALFKKEMKRLQGEMSTPERTFSKLIHNKAVEKVSEAVGSTIARPNAILYGSMFAFLLTAVVYFWAKHTGHELSGFETIGAFIIGWLAGMIVDYVRIMISGGKNT